mmetsp:Transcript_40680/g.123095  ORF Transcript_40680/g.123095 Transcript_40680/m.123095 type:complete len:241 (+) Transcript_40680:1447-2169(+)
MISTHRVAAGAPPLTGIVVAPEGPALCQYCAREAGAPVAARHAQSREGGVEGGTVGVRWAWVALGRSRGRVNEIEAPSLAGGRRRGRRLVEPAFKLVAEAARPVRVVQGDPLHVCARAVLGVARGIVDVAPLLLAPVGVAGRVAGRLEPAVVSAARVEAVRAVVREAHAAHDDVKLDDLKLVAHEADAGRVGSEARAVERLRGRRQRRTRRRRHADVADVATAPAPHRMTAWDALTIGSS